MNCAVFALSANLFCFVFNFLLNFPPTFLALFSTPVDHERSFLPSKDFQPRGKIAEQHCFYSSTVEQQLHDCLVSKLPMTNYLLPIANWQLCSILSIGSIVSVMLSIISLISIIIISIKNVVTRITSHKSNSVNALISLLYLGKLIFV